MVWWWSFYRNRRVNSAWYREQGRIGLRVRWDGLIAARIKGRRGVYEVFGNPLALDCTCDADAGCPHVKAVAAEYAAHEARFIDLRRLVASFEDVDYPDDLVERALLTNPGRVLDALERRRAVMWRDAVESTRPILGVRRVPDQA